MVMADNICQILENGEEENKNPVDRFMHRNVWSKFSAFDFALQVRAALCSGSDIDCALGEGTWGNLTGLDLELIKVSDCLNLSWPTP